MRYESGSAVLPNAFLNALLTNSKTSASERPSRSRSRHWFFEYFSPVSSAVRDDSSEARTTYENDDPLQWISGNWEEVTRQFPDQWIVIKKGAVVANSETASGLREQIRRLGIESPFITKTGRGSIVWRTAYGRY